MSLLFDSSSVRPSGYRSPQLVIVLERLNNSRLPPHLPNRQRRSGGSEPLRSQAGPVDFKPTGFAAVTKQQRTTTLFRPGSHVDDWATELLDRLAAGDKLNASDSARVPYATQLQQQYFSAVQQQKAESAASLIANAAAQGQTEILKQLAAVKRQSSDDLAVVRKELADVMRRTGYSLMMQRELAGLGEAWRQRGLH